MPDPEAALKFFRTYAESLRAGTPPGPQELEKSLRTLEQVAQDFQNAMEELRVADEELRQQNDEIVAARQLAEATEQRYQELFEFAPDG